VTLLVCLLSPLGNRAQEFRALWVDAWKPGFKSSAEVRQLIADTRAGHFNALVVEVRKRGDAYYQSRFEPRATDIASGYDPLADLCAQAHAGSPRLEIHAWIVTFPVWNSQTKPSQATHVVNQHPEWLMKDAAGATWDGSNYQLDPGHPEVQRHTYNVALDIISRYAVDGLHFDYVRYPGRDYGYNPSAVARFNAQFGRAGQPSSTDPQWLHFRRDQVTALVRKVYLSALALKPQVKISAATITWAPGITSDTQWSSTAAYSSVLQDWRAWMQEGILDINMPMAYFRQHTHAEDWSEWTGFAKDHRYRRHVAIGAGIYLNYLSNVVAQLRSVRSATAKGNKADGVVGFSYGVTSADATRLDFLNALTKPSAYDANPVPVFVDVVTPPQMPWKTAPAYGHLKGLVVHGLSGAELDGAVVRLSGPATRNMTNDATGFYGGVDLPPGSYTLTAAFPDLEPLTVPVSIAAGKVTSQDLRLSPPAGDLLVADLKVSPGEREAVLSWRTHEPATTQIAYGTSTNLGRLAAASLEPATDHCAFLSGLNRGAKHYFRILARADTNDCRTSLHSFRTAGELVIDNPAASFSGAWTLSSAAMNEYSSDYQYASTVSGAATATATFVPDIQTPGYYNVAVWYCTESNPSRNAMVQVFYDGMSVNVRVDQAVSAGTWRTIATGKHFARGTDGLVRLANNTGEASRIVIADAVRWSFLADQEPPPGQVPEWWAFHFFGRTVNSAADDDQDGYSNYREYLLGTDPASSSSQVRVSLEPNPQGGWRVLFHPYLVGRQYHLWRTVALASPAWEPTPNTTLLVTPAGQGQITDPNPPASRQFYRLEVDLAP
jgi:uncharacterized lipoprotein YddW (UPF0748 family)